jgi:transcriptional regulator with XRE-family HTH domain
MKGVIDIEYLSRIKKLGLKQNHLAHLIGISPSMLNRFLHDERRLKEYQLNKLNGILLNYELGRIQ